MQQSESKLRDGFTLIELSIVLVIIGLLVGGVLVGKDLITAASVRAQISQVEKYRTAANAFQLKYGGLPGDVSATNISATDITVGVNCDAAEVGSRNDDGLIDGTISGFTLVQAYGETGLFWTDLSAAKLIDGVFPSSSTNGMGCGKNNNTTWFSRTPGTVSTSQIGWYLPSAKLKGGTYLYVYEVNGFNWYGLSEVTSINGGSALISNASLAVIQAKNIDAKVDDGVPTTGIIRAVYINGSTGSTSLAPNAAADSSTTCYNTTGSAYSTSINGGNGTNCALSFRF